MVVSMHDEQIYAERALQAGARGYIMKTEGGEQLLVAIRQVLEGKIYVSERMSTVILNVFAQRQPAPKRGVLGELSGREFEIYQLIGQGLSTRQIGDRLCLSVPTIGTHRANIRRKLKLASGSELVQHAVRWAATQDLL
jgi:DNA-binding NarL/FixJ family response regulator